MNKRCALDERFGEWYVRNRHALSQLIGELCRMSALGNGSGVITFKDPQASERGPAKGMGLLQYRIEHRSEVARRRIDDLQHLGSRGLLLQRLARLGQEPRVLHRDDRLRREIFEQRNLLVGKWPHFAANGDDLPQKHIILA